MISFLEEKSSEIAEALNFLLPGTNLLSKILGSASTRFVVFKLALMGYYITNV
jgi:hypothetical protein